MRIVLKRGAYESAINTTTFMKLVAYQIFTGTFCILFSLFHILVVLLHYELTWFGRSIVERFFKGALFHCERAHKTE